jgi:peptide deformylase
VPVREVLLHPHPLLTRRAEPVGPGAAEPVVRDLLDTMRSFGHCVGIAAPQIGESVRVAVVDCTGHRKAPDAQGLLVLVNPVIVDASGSEIGREGCLSIPELTGDVRRATHVTVEADGVRVDAEGFEARALQHEIDHLDGLLFLDRVESLEADVFRRKRR